MTEQELSLLYAQLGYRIKGLRESAELNQSAFAEFLGLSRASIVNIEKGRQRPSLHLLLQISQILKVEISSIVAPLQYQFSHSPMDEKMNLKWELTIDQSSENNQETREKLTSFITEA